MWLELGMSLKPDPGGEKGPWTTSDCRVGDHTLALTESQVHPLPRIDASCLSQGRDAIRRLDPGPKNLVGVTAWTTPESEAAACAFMYASGCAWLSGLCCPSQCLAGHSGGQAL